MAENSPAFQRRGKIQEIPVSPEGTAGRLWAVNNLRCAPLVSVVFNILDFAFSVWYLFGRQLNERDTDIPD